MRYKSLIVSLKTPLCQAVAQQGSLKEQNKKYLTAVSEAALSSDHASGDGSVNVNARYRTVAPRNNNSTVQFFLLLIEELTLTFS